MNTDDQSLAVAVSTLALAVFMTLGVALSGVGGNQAVAQSGYGVDSDTAQASAVVAEAAVSRRIVARVE